MAEKQKQAEWLGITQATTYLDIKHAQYVRRLVKEGKLDSPVPAEKRDMGHYEKWFISTKSLDAYKARRQTRSGLRRYLLRAEAEDEAKIRAALDGAGIEYSLEFAYQPKDEAEETEESLNALAKKARASAAKAAEDA